MLSPISTYSLETCPKKNSKVGADFKWKNKDDSQLIVTSGVNINSDLQEDVLKALFEAEAKSRIEILRFTYSKCDGKNVFIL